MNQIHTLPLTRFPETPFFQWLLATLDRAIKRGFDIVAACAGLIALAPFFLLVIALLKRESAEPVVYRGQRAGRNGKNFGILKFRTMRDAENGARVTAHDDPRITPLGRWLRDTKLNELPQLWNVLVGEMSLVGPRPEDPDIVAGWDAEVRREVLSVRPGITSPASVLYRNEEALLRAGSVMETYLEFILPSKLRLDQIYVRHRSFILDLDVLFWTAMVLLPQWRAFAPPEEMLIFGPLRRLARRYLNWFVVDTLVTFAAIGLAGVSARAFAPLDLGLLKAIAIALGFSFLFSAIAAGFGMYRVAWSHANGVELFGLFIATAVACGVALVINQYISDAFALPPGMIVLAATFALAGFMLLRYRTRLFSGLAMRWVHARARAHLARERVLIIGSGYAGQFMAWLLSNGPSAGAFHIVGFADDDLYKQSLRIGGVSVLGRRNDIPRLVEKHDIGIIVFAIHNIAASERTRLLEICVNARARLVIAPDILGALNEFRATRVDAPQAARALDLCALCLARGERG
jgi:lipopolysaccharide/colanic/teichoic acid biosynthesis glycosyltransferase